jgi:hypothetical protein
MKYTVEQIMRRKPCYTEQGVRELIGDGKTEAEIATLNIPKEDIVWCLTCMLLEYQDISAVESFTGNCLLRAHYHAVAASNSAASIRTYASATYATASQNSFERARKRYYSSTRISYMHEITKSAALAAIYAAYAAYDDANAARQTEYQWQIDYLVEAIG